MSDHLDRLMAAVIANDAAKIELKEAVIAALKADMSVRHVASVTGMSTTTVQKIGHENGWPTPKQKAAYARARDFEGRMAETLAALSRMSPQPPAE